MGNEVINLGRKGKLLGGKADEELFNFVRGRRIGHGRGNESTKLIQARRRSSGFEDQGLQGKLKIRKRSFHSCFSLFHYIYLYYSC